MGEDEAATNLAARIAEAIHVLHDHASSPAARQAANQFVISVSEDTAAAGAAARILGPEAPAAARFFALRLSCDLSARGRLQEREALQLRDALTAACGPELSAAPAFVREKLAQALAALAIHAANWPAGWPDLEPRLLEAGRQSPAHAALALAFYRGVAEAFQGDAASARLTSQRRKELQLHLKDACGNVFQALSVFIAAAQAQGRAQELRRVAVLLIQELAGVVPLSRLLAVEADRFLHEQLADGDLRLEVLQAFTELVARDIAKDLKEAPDRTGQLLLGIIDLAGSCTIDALSVELYDAHKAVAMLVRDFVECNRPILERHVELQARVYAAFVHLLRYPSAFVQAEGATIVPIVLKAAFASAKKGGVDGTSAEPMLPPWLRLKAEVLPLLFLCMHKTLPSSFDLVPLPPNFHSALAFTSDKDEEEDVPGLRSTIEGRGREILQGLAPSPAAIRESLEYVHELLPRVLGAASGGPAAVAAAFPSFDAALGLTERIMINVKMAVGAAAVQTCGYLFLAVLALQAPSPEYEMRRLEFLGRAGTVLDVLAECSPEEGKNAVVKTFMHLFAVVEGGSKALRSRALISSTSICKSAPKAIRPVLDALVGKAVGLLSSIADNQHVLCESLVAASTAAQNFGQQEALLRDLLTPLASRWTPLVKDLSDPERLAACLLGDRSALDTAQMLSLCFCSCLQASTVPADLSVATAGGFVRSPQELAANGVRTRNPAGAVAASVLPGLAALLHALHSVCPSDVSRPMVSSRGASPEALRPYLLALDTEEVKALTSSLDSKGRDAEGQSAWENAFPPPPGQDAARILEGRHLIFCLRLHLYKCVGAALGVQDGVLTLPELPQLLAGALIESMEFAHPYHLELQLRHVWMVMFGPSGMQAATEPLREALVATLLPRLLAMAVRVLERYWQWLQLPQGIGESALPWAMCSGTVMASRTFAELLAALLAHASAPILGLSAAGGAGQELAMAIAGGGGAQRKKGKAKDRATAIAAEAMSPMGDQAKGDDEAMRSTSAASTGKAAEAKAGTPPSLALASLVLRNPSSLEAVQAALFSIARWKDPKATGNALNGLRCLAVQVMSGGEASQSLKEAQAAAADAPARCALAVRVVLRPLVELCCSKPEPPAGDGVLGGALSKPFADFFRPEKQGGGDAMSPFAAGVVAAMWPVLWGLCQVFAQVCKRAGIQAEAGHLAQFPAMVEACQALGSLPRASQQEVQNLVAKMLDASADVKVKRAALRGLICAAVDPGGGPMV